MGRSCRTRSHLSYVRRRYFYYKNNWWISLNKSGNDTQPLRKRSDFKPALSTLKRLHQEAGGDQLEPIPYWKYKQWRPVSSSSSTWWQWQESWSVFTRIHRKSRRKMHAKVLDRTVQPVVYRTLAKTSDERLSRIHFILLQLDRLQLTSVFCNRRGV